MTVRTYLSTDASAPTLQGVVGGAYSGTAWADGSLLNWFDKVLCTGYGSKTAAGWAKTYTGTSKGVFTLGAGTGFKFRLLDDGSATAGARECIIRGYEAMSDVDTGSGSNTTGFPAATDRYVRKSNTADATVRSWEAYADARTCVLYISDGNGWWEGYYFGDFYSLISGDAYNCLLVARPTSATAGNVVGNMTFLDQEAQQQSVSAGVHVARKGDAVAGGSQTAGLATNMNYNGGSTSNYISASTSNFGAPNSFNNRIYMRRIYVADYTTSGQYSIRGYLRGPISPIGISNMGLGYVFSGTGALAGKSFKTMSLRSSQNASARIAVETSDTWDTN